VAKKKAAPKSVDELVKHALVTAATKPGAKWAAASAAGLFNTKEDLHSAAQAECTKRGAELLVPKGSGGTLTAAGFARVADDLPKDEIGAIALRCVEGQSATQRFEFLSAAISRFPDAAAELTPELDAAASAKEAERAAEIEAATKRAAAREANLKALDRAREVLLRDRENEVAAVRKLWEALGQSATDLPALPEAKPVAKPKGETRTSDPTPQEPKTHEERDFRRYECDRLAAAWREAWDAGKTEGRDYLETAMWNIRGFKMIGEQGQQVAFDGRYHESDGAVFTDHPARIERPGWLLKTDDEEYIALKALVVEAKGG
jgi:hypothetical protein